MRYITILLVLITLGCVVSSNDGAVIRSQQEHIQRLEQRNLELSQTEVKVVREQEKVKLITIAFVGVLLGICGMAGFGFLVMYRMGQHQQSVVMISRPDTERLRGGRRPVVLIPHERDNHEHSAYAISEKVLREDHD